MVAYAANFDITTDPVYIKLISEIVRPFIYFLFGLALLYFMFGVVRFIWSMSRGDMTGKQDGQRHLLYGAIGLAIMLSVYGILNFVFSTITSVSSKDVTGNTIVKPKPIDGL